MILGNFNMKNLKGFRKPFSRFKFLGISSYLNYHYDNYVGYGRRLRKIVDRNIDGKLYKFCMRSLSYSAVTFNQLESAKKAIIKITGKQVKLDVCVCAYMPVTKKPAQSRMGKGKGKFSHWVFLLRPGQLIFEISGTKLKLAKKAFFKANNKFSLKMRFFSARDLVN